MNRAEPNTLTGHQPVSVYSIDNKRPSTQGGMVTLCTACGIVDNTDSVTGIGILSRDMDIICMSSPCCSCFTGEECLRQGLKEFIAMTDG